jgi:glycosyltransferase involved in cell wall biosynthesis
VRDGEDGYLFPPGDARALAERLLALSKDPSVLAAMRERLSGRAHKSLAENAAEYEALYSELLGSVRGPDLRPACPRTEKIGEIK